jgi:N-acetyl-anhydromuramyl-L-alanine amidase AmpD
MTTKAEANEAFVRSYQARRGLKADGHAGAVTTDDLNKLVPAPVSAAATPAAAGISYLTIHCAATPRGRDVKAAGIVSIGMARFGQPSYHHVIELDGSAVRTLLDNQKGAHVGGHNTGNIGICYVGGVEADMEPADTRTDAQKTTLRKLVAEYKAKYPGIIVRGHRDWPGVAKACPSFDVATAL